MSDLISVWITVGVRLIADSPLPDSDLLVGAGATVGVAGLAGLFIRSVLVSQKQTSDQIAGWKQMQDAADARANNADKSARLYYARALEAEEETALAKSIAQKAQVEAAIAITRAVAAERRAELCEQRLDSHWRLAHRTEPVTEFEEFA